MASNPYLSLLVSRTLHHLMNLPGVLGMDCSRQVPGHGPAVPLQGAGEHGEGAAKRRCQLSRLASKYGDILNKE